jgi:hypothetical protein
MRTASNAHFHHRETAIALSHPAHENELFVLCAYFVSFVIFVIKLDIFDFNYLSPTNHHKEHKAHKERTKKAFS